MLARLRSQRGASAIELVLYTPLMFMVIFLIIQFALIYHGNQAAQAAAREGARIARNGGGSEQALDAAHQRARSYAHNLSSGELTDIEVTAENVGGDYVRVEVCGRAREIIQSTTPRVCQHAEGPIEEFRPDL